MPQTILVKTVADLRHHLAPRRAAGQRIGFVPTMGALHAGHLSLVRAARRDCNCVVVSVFVNPTQFVAGEDYHSYPRCLQADLHACQREAVDLLFAPEVSEMYGPEPRTTVHVAGLTEPLCGAHRPGHFDGVSTVVAKLLNIVQPHVAYFGQKDAQQAVVLQKMVADLFFPVQIVVCPTVRDHDGLALSSRNAYLTPDQRRQARCLYQALQLAARQIAHGQRDSHNLIQLMQNH
ncbi:MAG: pantoate--beta-alanine ligase, partial [Phycisphaerae bacterium]